MKVRSIRSKVLIAITGITLLTAAAMAFVFYGRSSRMIEENYITVLSQRTRLLTDTVDDMLKNVCNIDIKASCVQVRHVSGSLTDHYDPRTKTVNLSDPASTWALFGEQID